MRVPFVIHADFEAVTEKIDSATPNPEKSFTEKYLEEAGIRGGVSMISNRYGKANNKYMENYNPDEESKFITYLDANNLYGWGMSQKLPYKNFRSIDEAKLADFDPTLINVEDDTGYILQVDL